MSKSVMDLSTMSEMKELSKSTSNLMTGGISMPKFKKKRPKSDSKASLLRSSQDSLSTISVNITKIKCCWSFLEYDIYIFFLRERIICIFDIWWWMTDELVDEEFLMI